MKKFIFFSILFLFIGCREFNSISTTKIKKNNITQIAS